MWLVVELDSKLRYKPTLVGCNLYINALSARVQRIYCICLVLVDISTTCRVNLLIEITELELAIDVGKPVSNNTSAFLNILTLFLKHGSAPHSCGVRLHLAREPKMAAQPRP